MVLALAIILFVIGDCMESAGRDWETSERNKERRHRELLEAQRRHYKIMESQNRRKTTVTRRRYLRDEKGRFISEEVSVEEDD